MLFFSRFLRYQFALVVDYETFCVRPLMTKKTIRTSDEGRRRQQCSRVAVEQNCNADSSGENAKFTAEIIVLLGTYTKRKLHAT